MNTQIAITIGLILATLLAMDGFVNDWNATVFVLRKQADLIEYLAFWR